MHLFRWRVKTPMIVTATLSVVMAIPIEMRKRSMRRFVAFHAAGARDLREAMRVSEMASIECGRRAALSVPSETNQWLLYDNPPRMLTPQEWSHWSQVFRKNVDLFRMMADQREATEQGYRRAMNRPWESPPPDVFKE
ncbi:MAG: hypothetical protein ACLQGP_35805 [Isosphaeraceae bacterium]